MITAWTKHLKTEEDIKRFNNSLLGSKVVMERLKEILAEAEIDLNRSETDIKTYDLPNWENKQAHKNGFRSCIQLVNKLINLDQKDNK